MQETRVTLLFSITLFTLGSASVSDPCVSTRVLPTQTVSIYHNSETLTSTDWVTPYTTVIETDYTTFCPEPTTFSIGKVTYTVAEPTTLTITDCPCTVTIAGSSPSDGLVAGTNAPNGKGVSITTSADVENSVVNSSAVNGANGVGNTNSSGGDRASDKSSGDAGSSGEDISGNDAGKPSATNVATARAMQSCLASTGMLLAGILVAFV